MTFKYSLIAIISIVFTQRAYLQDDCEGLRKSIETLLRKQEKSEKIYRELEVQLRNCATKPNPVTPLPVPDCNEIQKKFDRERSKKNEAQAQIKQLEKEKSLLEARLKLKGDTIFAYRTDIVEKEKIIETLTAERDAAWAENEEVTHDLGVTRDSLDDRNREIDTLTQYMGVALTRVFVEYEKGIGNKAYYIPLGDKKLNKAIGQGIESDKKDKAKIKSKKANRLLLLIEVFSDEPNDKLTVTLTITPINNRSIHIVDKTITLNGDSSRNAGKFNYFHKIELIDLKTQKGFLSKKNELKPGETYICIINGKKLSNYEIEFSFD